MEKMAMPLQDAVQGSDDQDASMNAWMCVLCGWVYDEAQGDPANGLPAGTRWADVPDSWLCPDCGVGKSEFILVQI